MAQPPVSPESVAAAVGVVVSVQGANPGPASGITYTVDVNVPGIGVQRFEGVAPDFGRWPDEVDVRAHEVGTACMAFFAPNGYVQFDLREIPDPTECPDG